MSLEIILLDVDGYMPIFLKGLAEGINRGDRLSKKPKQKEKKPEKEKEEE